MLFFSASSCFFPAIAPGRLGLKAVNAGISMAETPKYFGGRFESIESRRTSAA